MQNWKCQQRPNAKAETCDSFNFGLRLITNIHHQHDHVIERKDCTRHCNILRFCSTWRSTVAATTAKPSMSTIAKRKNGNVCFTKFRSQFGHQHPPPTWPHCRNPWLHTTQHSIKNLIRLTVHKFCHTCTMVNLGKDHTQKWTRVIHLISIWNRSRISTTDMNIL